MRIPLLSLFDYTPLPLEKVRERCCMAPRLLAESAGLTRERLIGPAGRECFPIMRLDFTRPSEFVAGGRVGIGGVASGSGTASAEGKPIHVRQGRAFLVAVSAPAIRVQPAGTAPLQRLLSSLN